MQAALKTHPCFFSPAQGRYGRVHLPVAPGCNISCLYCRRDYDCVNESRPGVTSRVLGPEEAVEHLARVVAAMPYISVAGVAGPGDPFHLAGSTLNCLELVRSRFPDLSLCVSTNGYNLAPHVRDLAALGVGFVTLTINAVDPKVGAELYPQVGLGEDALSGPVGAAELLDRQFRSLSLLKAAGMRVKVNTVLVPGINQSQIAPLAWRVATMGADLMNLIPVIPLEGTPLQGTAPPHPALLRRLRREAQRHLPQMTHCRRCRADAAGLLGESVSLCQKG